MANYHVLEVVGRNDRARVAFHISVPDENNFANVNIRTAVKQYLENIPENDGVISSIVPWITTELTDLQTGNLYEHVEVVEYNAKATNVQKRIALDNRYISLNTNIPDTLRERLQFWGMDRNVT